MPEFAASGVVAGSDGTVGGPGGTGLTSSVVRGASVATPSGAYTATSGDWIPAVLGTTTSIQLPPAPSPNGEIVAAGVSGSGVAPIYAPGAGFLSSAVNPTVQITLSAPLSTGGPITSLPVTALPAAIAAGPITIMSAASGGSTNGQTFVTTGAAAGATTVPITSITPTFAFQTTSQVTALASVTALPVNALPAAIPSGTIYLTSGTTSQAFTTTGAAQGATSVPITAAIPRTVFAAGSAVAAAGNALSGYYGLSASLPLNQGDIYRFQSVGGQWAYLPGPAQATQTPQAPGQSPLNPIWLTPVQWCLMNTDTQPSGSPGVSLGNGYVYASANGTGVGDTLTAGANGVLVIDGSGTTLAVSTIPYGGSASVAIPAVQIGDRVVVSDSYAHGFGSGVHPDGVYVVTSVGSAGSKWVLTRASDCNAPDTIGRNWAVAIQNGAVWGGGSAAVGYRQEQIGQGQPFTPGFSFVRLAINARSGLAWGGGASAAGLDSVALGGQTVAYGQNSVAIGNTAVASGNTSLAVGSYSTASNQFAHSLGPYSTASGFQATSLGCSSLAYADNQIAEASGNINTVGDAQRTRTYLFAKTTDATQTQLKGSYGRTVAFKDAQGAANYKRTALVNVTVVARRTDVPGTDSVWTAQGIIRGNGSNAYSWVGGSAPTFTVVGQDAAASTWALALSITTNSIILNGTGVAGSTIVWEATVQMDEVLG